MFDWLHSAGFTRLPGVVNGHVGKFCAAALRPHVICSQPLGRCDGRDLQYVPTSVLQIRQEFFADAKDWHANAAETSLMLAIAPELVRRDKLKSADDPDRTDGSVFAHPVNRTSKNGVTGFPSRASREQGEKLFQKMVVELSTKKCGGPSKKIFRWNKAILSYECHTIKGAFNEWFACLQKSQRSSTLKSSAELTAIKKQLIRDGVKYCVGAYVDIHGVPKGKFVPIDHFEHFAHGSELYTGYALDGLGQAPNDDEISSVPDIKNYIQLPWRKEVAWMPADNHFHGKPYPLNTRVLLQNVLADARKLGFNGF